MKLEKEIAQKFDQCKKATLHVESFDLLGGIGIFYKLNIKKATVRCDNTNKIIKKSYWNEDTKLKAEELKKELKMTKGGWYLMLVLVLLLVYSLGKVLYINYQYKGTYLSKTREEKQKVHAEMNEGDLVRTVGNIYKIIHVKEKTLHICKSDIIPTNHINSTINADKFTDKSFNLDNIIIINKTSFIKNSSINTDLNDDIGGKVFFQILDK